jgi:hypothetical protein
VFYYSGKQFINFGSVSMPYDNSNKAYYGIIDTSSNNDLEFYSCDFELDRYIQDMNERKYPGIDFVLSKYRRN